MTTNIRQILETFHAATNLDVFVYDKNWEMTASFKEPLKADFRPELLKGQKNLFQSGLKIWLTQKRAIIACFSFEKHLFIGWSANSDGQAKGIYDNKAPMLGVTQFTKQMSLLYFLIFKQLPQISNSPLSFPDNLQQREELPDDHQHVYFQGYLIEQEIMQAVTRGDLNSYNKLFTDFIKLGNFGVLAENALRSKKNLAIAATTLYTRAAVKGGVYSENAYRLSDEIIQQTEQQKVITNIYEYTRAIGELFLKRVMRVKRQSLSTITYRAQEYIYNQIGSVKSIEEIAEYVQTSKYYLMHLFKQETGQSVMQFVNQQKISEAKRELTFTSDSLGKLAEQLGFSSQSQFTNHFKQMTGLTPLKYRSQMRVN